MKYTISDGFRIARIDADSIVDARAKAIRFCKRHKSGWMCSIYKGHSWNTYEEERRSRVGEVVLSVTGGLFWHPLKNGYYFDDKDRRRLNEDGTLVPKNKYFRW